MLRRTLIAGLGLLAWAVLPAVPARAEPVVLKVAHFLSPNATAHAKVLVPWCELLKEQSQGEITCQLYPAMQLGGTPAQLVDQVRNGVADVVWTAPGYSSGRFPRIEAMELPFMIVDTPTGSRAAWDFAQNQAAADFEAFKVLAVYVDGGTLFSTAKADIHGPEDLKGLKIRVPTRLAAKEMLAFGAAPINMPAGQVTEAISKGVVDGALAPWELLHQTKLDEVTHFHTAPPEHKPMFVTTVLAVFMNKDTYARMSPRQQAVIDANSGAVLVERFSAAWEEAVAEARQAATARGNVIATLAPAQYDALVKAAEPVEAEWVRDVTAKGLDGAALARAAREVAARYAPK